MKTNRVWVIMRKFNGCPVQVRGNRSAAMACRRWMIDDCGYRPDELRVVAYVPERKTRKP